MLILGSCWTGPWTGLLCSCESQAQPIGKRTNGSGPSPQETHDGRRDQDGVESGEVSWLQPGHCLVRFGEGDRGGQRSDQRHHSIDFGISGGGAANQSGERAGIAEFAGSQIGVCGREAASWGFCRGAKPVEPAATNFGD